MLQTFQDCINDINMYESDSKMSCCIPIPSVANTQKKIHPDGPLWDELLEQAWMSRTEKRNIHKNLFCYFTHKLYSKDGKQACHFAVNSELKTIDYVALFKLQEKSAILSGSIASSTFSHKNKNIYYIFYQCLKTRPTKHPVK